MKKAILSLIIFLYSFNSYADFATENVNLNIFGGGRFAIGKYSNYSGFALGASASYKILDWLSLGPSLSYEHFSAKVSFAPFKTYPNFPPVTEEYPYENEISDNKFCFEMIFNFIEEFGCCGALNAMSNSSFKNYQLNDETSNVKGESILNKFKPLLGLSVGYFSWSETYSFGGEDSGGDVVIRVNAGGNYLLTPYTSLFLSFSYNMYGLSDIFSVIGFNLGVTTNMANLFK